MSAKRKTSAMATAVAMDDGDGHASKKRKVPVRIMLLLLLWRVLGFVCCSRESEGGEGKKRNERRHYSLQVARFQRAHEL